MIIYKATNILNNKCYIGQTKKTLDIRKRQHLATAESGNGFRFHKALREVGFDNFKWEQIDSATNLNQLTEKEDYWIKYYRSYDPHYGYNILPGKDNPMDCIHIKQHHDEVMRSEEVRKKISNSMKKRIAQGNFFGEEHRKRISDKLKGNQHFRGHKRTPEAIKKTAKGTYKKVACYDEVTGDLIKEFESVKSAAQWLYNDRCSDVTRWVNLLNVIKRSDVHNKPFRGLQWRYFK